MKENKLNFHHALKISVVAEDLITGENNFFVSQSTVASYFTGEMHKSVSFRCENF